LLIEVAGSNAPSTPGAIKIDGIDHTVAVVASVQDVRARSA
jgi:hypothetical protein